ncbi:MAG: S26 family signal peptidase [Thermoguttaceae bacterium]
MTNIRRPFRSVRRWTLISGCLLAVLSLGLVETWLVQGLLVRCRVVGGSMSPTLVGVHRDVTCGDCGFSFPCEAENAVRATCPNCGWAANRLTDLPDLDGDRVLVDRTAFWRRPPRRWDVVAMREPLQRGRQAVKRIVGLPGETIDIRHGDIFVDGRIVRKNLAEQRVLALLVHDADFPSRRADIPPRWRSESSDTRWKCDGGRFFFSGETGHPPKKIERTGRAGEPVDWLDYHHVQRLAGDAVRRSAVMDLGAYHPARPRREEDVHATSDLMLSLRVGPVTGRGAFWIRATDGRDDFRVRLGYEPEGLRHWQVFSHSSDMQKTGDKADSIGDLSYGKEEHRIEVSMIDRQFLLAIDGRTVAVRCDLHDRPPERRTSGPFGVAAEGIDVTVREVRVYRDVFYTAMGRGATRLPADHFYVLGDNSPESVDSRVWGENGAVDAKFLTGKILVAIPNVAVGPIAGRYFQVPNLFGMRYIQQKEARE